MSTSLKQAAVFVDPPSPAYYADRLFDTSNPILNRDDSLLPYARVREAFNELGIEVHTADLLPNELSQSGCDYYSLGVLENFRELSVRKDVRLRAFVILEPPVVEPRLYKALPELTAKFEQVYIHNTCGDGYSLKGVDLSRLRKLDWPQLRCDVIEPYWVNRERRHSIVVINGNHVPKNVPNELYSKRIEAMAAFARSGMVDLYGRGWDKWWSRTSMWWPYWKNYSTLMSIYKGTCESKYQVLSKFKFCLCLENMAMQGYVTEKIFDCFLSGTIPLYLGASNIQELIPVGTYIDCREFASWDAVLNHVKNFTDEEVSIMREEGRAFLKGAESLRYRISLPRIFNIESNS
jgi:hypothetical protein